MAQWISALKGKMQELGNLEDLFVMQLKELRDTEEQILDALPKTVDAASSSQLKTALTKHIDITKAQKNRLDEIFRRFDMEPESVKCEGIRGILSDGAMIMNARGDAAVRDAALIASAQQVEHFEMASYGACRTFAQVLGWHDVARILQQTLDEEGDTDKELTEVAISGINRQTAA